MAAVGRRQLVALLFLFFFVVSSTAVPVSRSLKTVKNQELFGSFHAQDVKEVENIDEGVLEILLERRMDIELTDYPGTGANHNHDPKPPGT